MRPDPLPDLVLEPLVQHALREDLGRAGDVTTNLTVSAEARACFTLRARQPGVLAGRDLARLAFQAIDRNLNVRFILDEGAALAPGAVLGTVEGAARSILTAERTALNFLCHTSGIASVTAQIVASVRHTKVRIVDTRKTTPGLRAIEKYAVRAGGGANHRFGLDDAVLIKDNHVSLAGGIAPAIERARAGIGHLVKIEVEVDTLEQLAESLSCKVDAVLLDNMSLPTLREAVSMVGGRALTEASGRITPDTAPGIAETGVDLISVGWITHSAPILDIGLDLDDEA